ncbi:MAG: inner membrane CreD family protein [Roseimicrobium sp.]
MTFHRILAVALITVCTAIAWFILGSALSVRTAETSAQTCSDVADVWGAPMQQSHPSAFFLSPTGKQGKIFLQPTKTKATVKLTYEPKKRGLLWHRTYGVAFTAAYEFANPTPIAQTLYVQFPLPSTRASYHGFSFTLGDATPRQSAPSKGVITEAIVVPPKATVPLLVTYESRGMDLWRYVFADASRVTQFELALTTNFDEINFPCGSGSPTARDEKARLYTWTYPDVLSAPGIGMDMPKVLNAGPVAARIAFFAPVSLVFFFTVLLMVGMVRGVNLHPMNYFLLAAGCFAFQLLFAYLVDLVPIHLSFGIAAVVSLVLVSAYVGAVGGSGLFWIALPAQLAYMVLFSYSFFFDGLTALTITIGAVATLGLLMLLTAKVNWAEKFTGQLLPPPPLPPAN